MERSKEHSFSRSDLHALVWNEPVRTVAKRLGISDVGLAKACRKAEIPLPSLGHWAKREAGKAVTVVALPPRGLGKSDQVTVGGGRYHYERRETDEEILATPIPPSPEFEESESALVDRVRTLVRRTSLPTNLKPIHPEIAKLLQADEECRQKQAASSYYGREPLFDTPLARRQLRLINSLFVALAELGYKSSLRGSGPFELYTHVGECCVSWKLEATPLRRASSSRNGARLSLHVHSAAAAASAVPLSWDETDAETLERHQRQMLEAIVLAGELNYRAGLVGRHEWRVERRQQLEEKARRRVVEIEEKRLAEIRRVQQAEVDRLFDETRRWRQAEDIRAYVDAQLAAAGTTQSGPLGAWAQWALGVAARIDPLQSTGR